MRNKAIKHTSGPWRVVNGIQIRSERDQIAKVWMMRGGEGKANAELLAAAPEMYKALKASTHTLHPQMNGEECLCSQCEFVKLRDLVVAKVEGGMSP